MKMKRIIAIYGKYIINFHGSMNFQGHSLLILFRADSSSLMQSQNTEMKHSNLRRCIMTQYIHIPTLYLIITKSRFHLLIIPMNIIYVATAQKVE